MAPGDETLSSDAARTVDETDTTDRPEGPDVPTGDPGGDDARGPTVGAGGRREVEVPQSLYKIVTVFSTLVAVLFVVLGFVVLDVATTVLSNPPGSVVVRLLSLLGPSVETLSSYAPTIAVVVGLAGLALVVAGAAVYVYGSRFRAPGMGKPKDEAGEESDDG